MRIILIRHGESTQNIYENHEDFPDFKVPLTELGKQQAEECGEFLEDFCKKNNIDMKNSKLYISPFERTRQTAKIINNHLNITDIVEDPLIVEKQYGLYDNLPYEERAKYPISHQYISWMYQNDGRFYAKMPLGESPLDAYVRARLFLQTLKQGFDKTENIFIVSHGMFLKVFEMAFFGYSVEWYNETGYMQNCSVKLIEKNGTDSLNKGYIFKGEKE